MRENTASAGTKKGKGRASMRKKIRNLIGIAIVRYVLHMDGEAWLVTRKTGEQQVIKIYSRQAYEHVVRVATGRKGAAKYD
jgi:hypothetical protein